MDPHDAPAHDAGSVELPPVVVDMWPPHVCLDTKLLCDYVTTLIGASLGVGLGDVSVETVESYPRRISFRRPMGDVRLQAPPVPTYATTCTAHRGAAVPSGGGDSDRRARSSRPSGDGEESSYPTLFVVDDDPMRFAEAAAALRSSGDGGSGTAPYRRARPSGHLLHALGRVLSKMAIAIERGAGETIDVDKGRWIARELEQFNPVASLETQVEACRQLLAQQETASANASEMVSASPSRVASFRQVMRNTEPPSSPLRNNNTTQNSFHTPSRSRPLTEAALSPAMEGFEAGTKTAVECDELLVELAGEQRRTADLQKTVDQTQKEVDSLRRELGSYKLETDLAVLRVVLLDAEQERQRLIDELAQCERGIDAVGDDVDAQVAVLERRAAAVRKALQDGRSAAS